jgi:PAS domain S-box-containing protein
MMAKRDDEDSLLHAVVRQNAESIFIARQRAERDLLEAKEALEARTAELAASLAMMQATLESTADGILVTDDAGGVTGFNEQFVEMWGLSREVMESKRHGSVLGAMATQLAEPAAFRARFDAVLAAAPPDTFESISLADGRVFELCTRVQRIDGRAVGRVWNYRDVTERARAETALLEAKTKAEAANRAKSSFLAMMSHELRTPLNAIAGYAQLLQMGIHGPVTAEQRHAIDRIQASQQHLLTLIDDVLIQAKLEIGSISYERTRVGVHGAVAGAEALLAPQAEARQIAIRSDACAQDVAVLADEERVRQILLNLLANAIKFTEPGGRVEISCAPTESNVAIRVRDSGIGIAADMLNTIFEPFVQVRSDHARSAEGTGLGLAISRALARGMDGDVTVESEPGVGSTFTLTLPAG